MLLYLLTYLFTCSGTVVFVCVIDESDGINVLESCRFRLFPEVFDQQTVNTLRLSSHGHFDHGPTRLTGLVNYRSDDSS